jgi:DNA-binding CsgD family transcriptional regulator
MVLTASDCRLLNRFLLELHRADSALVLRAITLSALRRLAPGGSIGWSYFHSRTGRAEHGTVSAAQNGDLARTLEELAASRSSSSAGRRQGWQTLARRRVGSQSIGTVIEGADGGRLCVVLCRPGQKFDRRERELLNLILPHLHLCFQKVAAAPAQSAPRLSAREGEVLRWMVEGKRNGEIATILGASPRTVEKHVAVILTKLNVENRASAIRHALQPRAAEPGAD